MGAVAPGSALVFRYSFQVRRVSMEKCSDKIKAKDLHMYLGFWVNGMDGWI